jgi:hypothetical protein
MRFKIEERYERANENLGSSGPPQARSSLRERASWPSKSRAPAFASVLRWISGCRPNLWPVSDGTIEFQPIHAAINLGLIAL